MLLIPTDTVRPFWNQITTLDGVDFMLQFKYNQREDCYYLQVQQTDLTVIAQGIKLVSNFRLLQAYADARMPTGELLCLATGSDDSPARLGELGAGQRVRLVYITREELVAAGKDLWRL